MAEVEETLKKAVLEGKWKDVIGIYEKHAESHKFKINDNGDTAIHKAISDEAAESFVEALVSLCPAVSLAIGNATGATPLHAAASTGNALICRCIAARDSRLIGSRNENGETPLHSAALAGSMDAFVCLLQICEEHQYMYYRSDIEGHTILHSAIWRQHYDIAYDIINHHPELVHMVNEYGTSPLHLLARNSSAFKSCQDHPTRFAKFAFDHLTSVSKLKLRTDADRTSSADTSDSSLPKTGHGKPVGSGGNRTDEEANQQVPISTSSQGDGRKPGWECLKVLRSYMYGKIKDTWSFVTQIKSSQSSMPKDGRPQSSCVDFLRSCIYETGMSVLNLVMIIAAEQSYSNIQRRRAKCEHSVQVMEGLLTRISKHPYKHNGMCPEPYDEENRKALLSVPSIENSDDNPTAAKTSTYYKTEETPILAAAKHGVVEMVKAILRLCPDAIFEVDKEKKNIVMLAVQCRKLALYDFLRTDPTIKRPQLFGHVDMQGNSVVHIAADLRPGSQHWRVPGSALQLYMETKWYSYVKSSVPYRIPQNRNHNGETPRKIFRVSHEKLLEEGRQWMIDNSQSCSVIAALIATVAFATSATFPGSFKQDGSGIPALVNEPIFIIAAVTALSALCFSMLAVLSFLKILTSRFDLGYFSDRRNFNKLSYGMLHLQLSIVSMLFSFFAGHYFLLKQKSKHAVLAVYLVFTFPFLSLVMTLFPKHPEFSPRIMKLLSSLDN